MPITLVPHEPLLNEKQQNGPSFVRGKGHIQLSVTPHPLVQRALCKSVTGWINNHPFRGRASSALSLPCSTSWLVSTEDEIRDYIYSPCPVISFYRSQTGPHFLGLDPGDGQAKEGINQCLGSVRSTLNQPSTLGTGALKASRDTVPFGLVGEGLQKSSSFLLPEPTLNFSPCKRVIYLLQFTSPVN